MVQVYVTIIKPNGTKKELPNPRKVTVEDGVRYVTYRKRRVALNDKDEIDLRARTSQPRTTTENQSSTVDEHPKPQGQISPSVQVEVSNDSDGQDEVITAAPSARLLVDAGPGAGKSHVACQRVVELVLEHRIQAGRIWMISFTRTAVREVRDRIETIADQTGNRALAGLRPTTLDSLTARLRLGSGDILSGGYNQNISDFIDALDTNEGLREEISKIRHVLIDEAQDIVGQRADLVCRLLEILPDNCGVTVFADAAQAIYGFSEGEGAGFEDSLLERVTAMDFETRSLKGQYRTAVPNLLEIFSSVRQNVLDGELSSAEREEIVRDRIVELAEASPGQIDQLENLDSDAFVLYRRRIDVLFASSLLNKEGVRHRLRLSGFPAVVHPWVGGALALSTDRRINQKKFEELWAEKVAGSSLETVACGEAWERLLSVAGDRRDRLDLGDLNELLSRRPPLNLCLPDFGESGPVLGTIHAAKGREADTVHLMLPEESQDEEMTDNARDEETRVVFVGATRARKELYVGSSHKLFGSSSLESERAVKRGRNSSMQVEIGREGDLDAEGVIGLDSFPSVSAARKAQGRLPSLVGEKIIAKTVKIGSDYRYQLFLERDQDGDPIGLLSTQLGRDIWEATKKLGAERSPGILPFLHIVGLTTIAAPSRDRIHEPWQTSGLALAPLVTGLTYFRRWK